MNKLTCFIKKYRQCVHIMNKLDRNALTDTMKTQLWKKIELQKDKIRCHLYKNVNYIFSRRVSLQLKQKKYTKRAHSCIHSWGCPWEERVNREGLQLCPQQMQSNYVTPEVDSKEEKNYHNSPTLTQVRSQHFGILPVFSIYRYIQQLLDNEKIRVLSFLFLSPFIVIT